MPATKEKQMNILSEEFTELIKDVISNGIKNVWVAEDENIVNNYGEDYSHCNSFIYEINKNLIIESLTNKFYEIHHGYANAQYGLEIKKLKIKSITEQILFFKKPINYTKFDQLCNIKIQSIKPEVQIAIIDDAILRSISFYSKTKFEFAMIGEDNLKSHKTLDRPMFDGCWLILDKEIIDINI